MQGLLKRKSWELAIISGSMIGLSFPPFKLGFLAWIGLVPLIKTIIIEKPLQNAWSGFIAGFFMNLLALHWLSFNIGAPKPFAIISLLSAAIYLALFWSFFCFVFSSIQSISGKGLLIMPSLWVLMEFIMSIGPLGFPWVSLATTQVDYLPIIQVAEWTGIYGVSFWVVTINVILYGLINSHRSNRIPIFNTLLFTIVSIWLLGYLRLATLSNQNDKKQIKVSITQPNVGPHDKWEIKKRNWVFSRLDSLYMLASEMEPDVIIWPEAATPAFLTKNHSQLLKVRRNIRQSGIPLLTGTIDWSMDSNSRSYFNSVALIGEEGEIPIYHKNQLVPIGEFNPFARQLPSSQELNLGNYTRGKEKTIFKIKESYFASIVCFESVFPRIVRKLTNIGAQFLVIVVNDGWYGNSAELYQHEAIARFRAIEHRYPVIRSANTGISAIIDRSGQEIKTLGIGETGVITASIVPFDGDTFYGRYGDWIVTVSLLSLLIISFNGWRKGSL